MVNYSSTSLNDLNNKTKKCIDIFKNIENLKFSHSQFVDKTY